MMPGLFPGVPGGGITVAVPLRGGGTVMPGSVFGGRTTPEPVPVPGLAGGTVPVCGAGTTGLDGAVVCARAG